MRKNSFALRDGRLYGTELWPLGARRRLQTGGDNGMLKPAMRLLKSIALLAPLFALTACFLPERFEARVTFNKDGSYNFVYDGTIAFFPYLVDAAQGQINPKVESDMRLLASELARDPLFKSVTYSGNGRYRVLCEKTVGPGKPFYFFGEAMRVFSVVPQPDGSIMVAGEEIDRKLLGDFQSIGAQLNGTLKVYLPSNATAVQHNAASTPGLFSSGYMWQVHRPDAPRPFIIVRL